MLKSLLRPTLAAGRSRAASQTPTLRPREAAERQMARLRDNFRVCCEHGHHHPESWKVIQETCVPAAGPVVDALPVKCDAASVHITF